MGRWRRSGNVEIMGEHEEREGGHVDIWEKALEVSSASSSALEFQHAAQHASHATQTAHTVAAGPKFGAAQALAPLALYNGIKEMLTGETVYDRVGGGLEAASGVAGTLSWAGAASGGGAAAGGAAAGGGGFLGALGPIGAVLGAAAAGWGAGTKGNKIAREKGFLGKKADGENRNWSDVFGESAFSGGGGASAGPMLVATGAGALATTTYDLGKTIGAIPSNPVDEDTMKLAQQIILKEQAETDHASQGTYNQLVKSGTSAPAAEALTSLTNSHWSEQHDVDKESQKTYAAAIKSGMSKDAAASMVRVSNPRWLGPQK